MKGHFSWAGGVLGLALAVVLPAGACTVPVFRYALDHWEPDAYRLVVDQVWAASPEGLRLLAPLRGNGPANVVVVEEATGGEARLEFTEGTAPIWEGKLDAATLDRLLASPARAELVRRLVSGDSVVWVVSSGAGDEDRAAVERLESRLRFMEQVASLPEQDPSDPESRLGPGPKLALRFSVLRVEAGDPAEGEFRKLLGGPDGAEGAAFASAVFGRGRVLDTWPLAALEDATIEDVCLFLIGRCSCRVKNENPGWDLLLRADWGRELAAAGESAAVTPELPRETSVITTTTTTEADPEPGRRETPWRALAGLGMAAGLAWAGWNLWRPK